MICHIHCADITSAEQLHQTFDQYLGFPEWYGYNLDALYDCLTELPGGTQIFLRHWNSGAPWAAGFEAVLKDAQLDNPELKVVFD